MWGVVWVIKAFLCAGVEPLCLTGCVHASPLRHTVKMDRLGFGIWQPHSARVFFFCQRLQTGATCLVQVNLFSWFVHLTLRVWAPRIDIRRCRPLMCSWVTWQQGQRGWMSPSSFWVTQTFTERDCVFVMFIYQFTVIIMLVEFHVQLCLLKISHLYSVNVCFGTSLFIVLVSDEGRGKSCYFSHIL